MKEHLESRIIATGGVPPKRQQKEASALSNLCEPLKKAKKPTAKARGEIRIFILENAGT